jgi:hypothetical protein
VKLCNEIEGILRPWLAILSAEKATDQLKELQRRLDGRMLERVGIDVILDGKGDGLMRDEAEGIWHRCIFGKDELDRRIEARTDATVKMIARQRIEAAMARAFAQMGVGR